MSIWGAVEIGGTNTKVTSGQDRSALGDVLTIETKDPAQTLGPICEKLALDEVTAVGVASFGPLDLDVGSSTFGHITATPKPGWSGTDVVGTLETNLGVPVKIDTDVNAAALGEWKWGAAGGASNVAYVTVGTGIGGGLVFGGRPVFVKSHPEFGHTIVVPHADDPFAGICPFHGGCLEGMASGPALQARFGTSPDSLGATEAARARDLSAFYVAQGLRNMIYVASPDVIVLGGGVSHLQGFHDQVRLQLTNQLSGYPGVPTRNMETYVVPPALGDVSGLAGALAMMVA